MVSDFPSVVGDVGFFILIVSFLEVGQLDDLIVFSLAGSIIFLLAGITLLLSVEDLSWQESSLGYSSG